MTFLKHIKDVFPQRRVDQIPKDKGMCLYFLSSEEKGKLRVLAHVLRHNAISEFTFFGSRSRGGGIPNTSDLDIRIIVPDHEYDKSQKKQKPNKVDSIKEQLGYAPHTAVPTPGELHLVFFPLRDVGNPQSNLDQNIRVHGIRFTPSEFLTLSHLSDKALKSSFTTFDTAE